MEIRHIHISNFRGFEQRSFEFKAKFSVAIGNNGVGKSSLLNALQVGLGAILQSIPTLPANYIFRRQFRRGERYVKFDTDRKDFMSNKNNPSIKMVGDWYHNDQKDEIPEPIMWERHYLLSNSTTHNKLHSAQIIYYGNFLYENHGAMPHVLYPILANFYINRTNAQVRRVDKRWKRMSRLEKGYFASLGDSVDFTGVYEWLYSFDTLVRDGKEFDGTREAMFAAIKIAIPYIKEIGYNTKYDEFEVLVDFEDGQPIERKLASLLSDGMKAVLYMVAEIAYRCVMLNGKLGERAIIDSPGVVLIDEIDMHLHPKWQKRIVYDIKNAFPKLQFIVTTHSPFIVQSLHSDELINLDIDKVKGLDEDPSRHSIEEVSTGEMGVPDVERSKLFLQMQNDAKEYFGLIKNKSDKDAIAKAKRKLDELRIKFNSDPAYVAFLESELKEEE